MYSENEVYIIDIGNTRAKIALFENQNLKWTKSVSNQRDLLATINKDIPIAISNVSNSIWLDELKSSLSQIHEIDRKGMLPFSSNYETPDSLGIDRICNMAALCNSDDIGKNRLVIDIGTCIKFDLLNSNNTYKGGSISPGIQLRYNALNDYTEALPRLQHNDSNFTLTGNSTESSIRCGVMGSIQAELKCRLQEFNNSYHNLQVFITGGDAHYFDLGQKNNIFVDENLTLKGIYALYKIQS